MLSVICPALSLNSSFFDNERARSNFKRTLFFARTCTSSQHLLGEALIHGALCFLFKMLLLRIDASMFSHGNANSSINLHRIPLGLASH